MKEEKLNEEVELSEDEIAKILDSDEDDDEPDVDFGEME